MNREICRIVAQALSPPKAFETNIFRSVRIVAAPYIRVAAAARPAYRGVGTH